MLSVTRTTFLVGFLLVSQVFALVPRDTNPCASDCAAYTQDAACTTSSTCQCTATIANELQTCINCIVNVGKADADVITNAQTTVSVYMGLCSGFNLPSITVAGSVESATTAGGSSATGGVSATTTTNTPKSSSASASATGSQATSTAPSTSSSGQKSGAISAHRLIAVGPHVVVGAIVGMILAV